MGKWNVEPDMAKGILSLRLEGTMSPEDMDGFVTAHNRAIESFGAHEYRVFCDIRKLAPLSPDAAQRFESAKGYSAARKNFQGSAVLADGKLVALQHQRTSVSSGVMPTELISESEAACMAHLASVRRSP